MTYHRAMLLFGDDFDAPALPPPPAACEVVPLPPPSYGIEALEAAQAAARAEGYASGRADAAADDAARAAAALATIAEQLADAAASAARTTEAGADAVARMVLAAVLAGYPNLRARFGADELRVLVRRTLPGMLLEPRVTVQVHPSMAAVIAEELAAVAQPERAHITVEPSEAIPPGDARIAWPHGGAIRQAEPVAAAIADILRPLGLLPEPEPDAESR